MRMSVVNLSKNTLKHSLNNIFILKLSNFYNFFKNWLHFINFFYFFLVKFVEF